MNPRQLKFTENVAAGMILTDAYLAAGYRMARKQAASQAYKLLRKPEIAEHLAALRRETAARASMTRDELVSWLCDAVRTPVGGIDEDHPLAQEVLRDYRAGEVSRVKVKGVAKMDAAKLLVAMLGWNSPEKITLAPGAQLAEAIRALGGDGGPETL